MLDAQVHADVTDVIIDLTRKEVRIYTASICCWFLVHQILFLFDS